MARTGLIRWDADGAALAGRLLRGLGLAGTLFLLCRSTGNVSPAPFGRALLAADGRWMGRDRKRGALMDLNRLLLGEPGAEEAFAAEGSACGRLKGRFILVVTLDADTRLLPGDLRALIGAMAHPLNRRYAVLQHRPCIGKNILLVLMVCKFNPRI